MVSSLLIPKQDPGRLLDLSKVAQDVSGKRQIRSSNPCAPGLEPGSVVSPGPPFTAWAEPGLHSGSLEAGRAAAEGTDRLILTSRDLQDPSLHHQTATPLCWNRQRKGSGCCSQGQHGHFLPHFQNLALFLNQVCSREARHEAICALIGHSNIHHLFLLCAW